MQPADGGELHAALGVQRAERVGHDQAFEVGKELVQRRVEEADGDGQGVHRGEDALEVRLLGGLQGGQGGALLGGVVGEDEAAHQRQAVVGEEHVLRAAQADALGAQAAGVGGVGRVVGVGPHHHGHVGTGPHPVRPVQQGLQLGRGLGGAGGGGAEEDLPGAPVDGDLGAGRDHAVADVEAGVVDDDLAGTHDGGNAPAAGHDGGVRGDAAAGGEDAAGALHAEHVVRRGLVADEDDGLALVGGVDGVVGGEDHDAGGRARRCPEGGGQQDPVGRLVEGGVQERADLAGGHGQQGVGDRRRPLAPGALHGVADDAGDRCSVGCAHVPGPPCVTSDTVPSGLAVGQIDSPAARACARSSASCISGRLPSCQRMWSDLRWILHPPSVRIRPSS